MAIKLSTFVKEQLGTYLLGHRNTNDIGVSIQGWHIVVGGRKGCLDTKDALGRGASEKEALEDLVGKIRGKMLVTNENRENEDYYILSEYDNSVIVGGL